MTKHITINEVPSYLRRYMPGAAFIPIEQAAQAGLAVIRDAAPLRVGDEFRDPVERAAYRALRGGATIEEAIQAAMKVL